MTINYFFGGVSSKTLSEVIREPLVRKNDLDIGWTRTRIVRIEGTYDDHLTTTKANLHLFGQVNY